MMFSKDDMMSVEFVSAAANIRANNFGVPMDSLFKVKEMAGKIVPAISSSNALGASLQVTECIKLLAKKTNSLRGIVYQRTNDSVRLNSFSRANDIPNPDC
jgi:ubiquitin-like 1-activating enzyme E1 B